MAIIIARTFIVFFALLISLRLMGKRQLGELELTEFVITLLISNVASHPLQDIGIPILNGLMPIILLLCAQIIISGISAKNSKVRRIICGSPSILVTNGVINQREMGKNRFTLDELAEELRNQSVLDLNEIQYAILETDGSLNVILTPQARPVTAGQMELKTKDTGYPSIIINQGSIMENNLKMCGKDFLWLEKVLKEKEVSSHKEVFLMTLNDGGEIYFAKKEKKK